MNEPASAASACHSAYFGFLFGIPADGDARRLKLEARLQLGLQVVPEEKEVVGSDGQHLSIRVVKADLVNAFGLDFFFLEDKSRSG